MNCDTYKMKSERQRMCSTFRFSSILYLSFGCDSKGYLRTPGQEGLKTIYFVILALLHIFHTGSIGNIFSTILLKICVNQTALEGRNTVFGAENRFVTSLVS